MRACHITRREIFLLDICTKKAQKNFVTEIFLLHIITINTIYKFNLGRRGIERNCSNPF